MKLSYEEKIARLQLIRTPGIGPVTFWNLLKLFGSASNCLDKIPDMSLRGGSNKPKEICSKYLIEKEYDSVNKINGRILFKEDDEYPKLLKNIQDPPPAITIIGDIPHDKKMIAVIGARSASLNAKKFTERLVHDLSDAGFCLISGFARGIDSVVHKYSESTIAVFAGGIDVIYPADNKDLYESIIQKGAVISESAFGTEIQASLFPRRNRVIAAMSSGVVVIEAAMKSGSLITANFALDYNRDVFAVPGFPEDPRCMGSNELIKKGAILVTSAEDIINNNLFNYSDNVIFDDKDLSLYSTEIDEKDLDKYRNRIVELLSYEPVSIDLLIEEIGSVQIVQMVLIELELADKAIRMPINKVALKLKD